MKRFVKYLACALIQLRWAARERGELYGRALFCVIIVAIFSALWRAVAEAGMPLSATPARLVWYLAATQWVLLSAPQMQVDIQNEVTRGDIAYQLLRPLSYVTAKLAQGAGMLLFRLPLIGASAVGSAYVFTGVRPPLTLVVWLLPFGVLAAFLAMTFTVGIGLLSFWITDVNPVFWLWQKMLFVLGGLMLPLELYPSWLQRVAFATPFPSILSGPGRLLLQPPTTGELLRLFGSQLFWLGCSWLLLALLFKRAARSITVGGG